MNGLRFLKNIEVKPDIHWVGVNDRITDLFEGVWPLPKGVSYNSYLIESDKTALVDSVKADFEDEFLEKIEEVTNPSEIDYVIVNHMEPDHSGALPTLRRLAPDAEILCTEKAVDFLESLYGITENIKIVEDGEEIDLGDRTLKFFETPFVHWPETMMTYEPEEKVLFSGDAFGGFGALGGGIFDDEVDLEAYESEILRYFSNIVGMYTATVQRALQKLEDLEVNVIAPTHGPIWRTQPEKIIELYDRWSKMEGEDGITIIYGSMYGNTEELMESVAAGVKSQGCKNIRILDASRVNLSYLLSEAWRREGLIIGTPTYDARIFPPVDHFVKLARKKKLRNRVTGIFGSFGWSGGALDRIDSIIEELEWDLVEPITEFKGKPNEKDLEKGFELGENIAKKIMS